MKASKAYYIKLGKRGKWERESIEQGILKIGFNNPLHQNCLRGEWNVVESYWLTKRQKTKGKARSKKCLKMGGKRVPTGRFSKYGEIPHFLNSRQLDLQSSVLPS